MQGPEQLVTTLTDRQSGLLFAQSFEELVLMGGHLGRIKALVLKTGYSTQAMSLLFGLEVSDAGYKPLLHCSVSWWWTR